MRRPAHKLAHAHCPYGVLNWAECDAAASHRWGRCAAMVDVKPEPHTCTNWAVAEDGWCGQHYVALHEKAIRKARMADRTLQLNAAIDAFLAKSANTDWRWWEVLATSAEGSRGLAGIGATPVATLPVRPALVRNKPFRITEL